MYAYLKIFFSINFLFKIKINGFLTTTDKNNLNKSNDRENNEISFKRKIFLANY